MWIWPQLPLQPQYPQLPPAYCTCSRHTCSRPQLTLHTGSFLWLTCSYYRSYVAILFPSDLCSKVYMVLHGLALPILAKTTAPPRSCTSNNSKPLKGPARLCWAKRTPFLPQSFHQQAAINLQLCASWNMWHFPNQREKCPNCSQNKTTMSKTSSTYCNRNKLLLQITSLRIFLFTLFYI